MYPDFYHLLKDLFGVSIPVLSLFKTFGFIVALSFFAAAYFLMKELKRKEDEGLIGFQIDEITTGKKTTIGDYISNLLIGFLLGYKMIGMFLSFQESSHDPLNYLLSLKGNLAAGILLALILLAYKAYSTYQNKDVKEETKKVKVYPHTKGGDIAVIAAIGGFAGAKVFNALETWDSFIADPLGSLFSSSGLTFYGGLIVATIALWYYSKKIKLDFRHLCDAAGPALILAYGLGRLGCQVSGDGDWGIFNSAYITDMNTYKVVLATKPFSESVIDYRQYLQTEFSDINNIPHKSISAPSFLPTSLFAYNYPKNVNNVGITMNGVNDEYNSVLPLPVFPTPVYELGMCLIIFGILWKIRKRWQTPLSIFSVYLIFNGIERFFIEQFRVNSKYDLGFIQPTQAEIIAVCISLIGILLFIFRKKIDSFISAKPN
ncbi:MAG: prolipoprotein diacylglyceryl transferase [Chitinophagaceae bacterium]|nr:prolipoprotein diacylglyceryl transferase [Chitinophagaceae bacterium]